MSIRFILQAAAALTIAFAASIGVVRTQPHDDSALRAFLSAPDGCPSPCWQGVRPGVTSADEAVRILDGHPWIRSVDYWGTRSVVLRWSGRQPEIVNAMYPAIMTVEDGVVQRLSLPTKISFGDLWLMYDQPERGGFLCLERAWRASVLHFATYPQAGFAISLSKGLRGNCYPNVAGEHCPLDLRSFWDTRTDVILGPVYIALDDYRAIRSATPPYCFR